MIEDVIGVTVVVLMMVIKHLKRGWCGSSGSKGGKQRCNVH